MLLGFFVFFTEISNNHSRYSDVTKKPHSLEVKLCDLTM